MPNWIQISADDLEAKKVAALVSALRTAALGAGQEDPTDTIIAAVVDRIRRKIASCAANRLDAEELAIPRGLKTMAVDMVLAEMKNRLEIELTADERARLDVHEADLNRIAACKELVEQPDDIADTSVQGATGTPSFAGRERAYGRDAEEGL